MLDRILVPVSPSHDGITVTIHQIGRTDTRPDREYLRLLDLYRRFPDVLAAELPHHDPRQVARLAASLSLVCWRDLIRALVDTPPDDLDIEVTQVIDELRRRALSSDRRDSPGIFEVDASS
jgi:hypothetical protein